MVRNIWPIWIMFFYVFFCNIYKVKQLCFIILLRLIFSFLHIRSLLVPYAYVFIESIDHILLSSFELKAILLISSVKTLCPSLLNLCCVCNISLFYCEFFLIFFKTSYITLNSLFFSLFELLQNSLYNLEIYVFFL